MKFRAALGFFTRLPVGSAPLPPTFQGVIVWLPAIGLIVGLLAALAVAVATLLLPAQLGGVIGCLVWVFITGGLHLDGVADCGDGLLVEAPPERRLEIMKDSRLGTFGGAALFFVLALKAAALCTLAASFDGSWSGLLTLAGACCMAGALARSMVFPAMHIPSARPGGLGAALHNVVVRRPKTAGRCHRRRFRLPHRADGECRSGCLLPAVRHTEGGFPTGSVQPTGWSPASEGIDNPVPWISTSVF